MTHPEVQEILDEAERRHAAGWAVDHNDVGAIYQGLNVDRQAADSVRPEVWLAMRAISIGRGFAVEAELARERSRTGLSPLGQNIPKSLDPGPAAG